MSATMRAVVLHGPRDVRLESIERPAPVADEVLIRVTVAGICGTDANFYMRGAGAQSEGFKVQCPVVLGHEFAGVVEDVGPDVERLAVGDLVVSGASVACGECEPCSMGLTNICVRNQTAGIHRDGGLAEYCAIPERACEPASPFGVAGDDAGLGQPMSIAHHGVMRGQPKPGDRVLVIGVGGIGMFAVWIASNLGAHVTAVDLGPERLEIAARLGAAETVALEGRSLEEALDARERWEVIYEVTGAAAPLAAAIQLARKGTRVVLVGVQKEPLTLDASRVVAQEISILGSAAQVRSVDLPEAIRHVGLRGEGWSDVAPTVLALDRVVDDGLIPLAERRADAVKILVDPQAESTRPYAR